MDRKLHRVIPTEDGGNELAPGNARTNVLLIGDSLTQFSFSLRYGGWGAQMAEWYVRWSDVVNRGFSGWNSRWIVAALDRILPERDPNCILVTICLGANDAQDDQQPLNLHVPLTEYVTNICEIVKQVRIRLPRGRVVLITPPMPDESQWCELTVERTRSYAEAILKLGAELEIPVLNLWDDLSEYKINLNDLYDGLHYNEIGNGKVFKGLQAIIKQHYPEIVPELGDDGEFVLPPHLPFRKILKPPFDYEKLVNEWSWTPKEST